MGVTEDMLHALTLVRTNLVNFPCVKYEYNQVLTYTTQPQH